MKTIAFYTLGCKLNFAETSTLAEKFRQAGYIVTEFHSISDIYVIHTCSVTSAAEKKSRQAIRQARKRNPDAFIAVIGCYSELRSNDIKSMGCADIILGNSEKYNLLEYINNKKEYNETYNISNEKNFVPAVSLGDRTRSFLKIQDGCDYFCAYCTIPYARGRSRSAKIIDVINLIKTASKTGVKEIVLTGVNVGDFGKNNAESFYELLLNIEKNKYVDRIRISSIEPDLLHTEIIDFIANSEIIAPHFHISLQSGSDVILKTMGRKYDTNLFKERVNLIKQRIPDAFIAADVITGFPGETEEEFYITKKFIESLPLSELHVFTYSERPGTKAIKLDGNVQNDIRKQRTYQLLKISDKKKFNFYETNIGREQKVLWESNNYKGYMNGYTANYLKIKSIYDKNKVNTLEKVKLSKFNNGEGDEVFFYI